MNVKELFAQSEKLHIHYEEFAKHGLAGTPIVQKELVKDAIALRRFAPGECIVLTHVNGTVLDIEKIKAPEANEAVPAYAPSPAYQKKHILDARRPNTSVRPKKHYIKCSDYKKHGIGYVPFFNRGEAIKMVKQLDLTGKEYIIFTYLDDIAIRAIAGSKPTRKKKNLDNATKNKPRIFKVSYRYFQREKSESKAFPQIRLQGKWLEEIGFQIGGFMGLSCEQGKIVLTPLPHPEE